MDNAPNPCTTAMDVIDLRKTRTINVNEWTDAPMLRNVFLFVFVATCPINRVNKTSILFEITYKPPISLREIAKRNNKIGQYVVLAWCLNPSAIKGSPFLNFEDHALRRLNENGSWTSFEKNNGTEERIINNITTSNKALNEKEVIITAPTKGPITEHAVENAFIIPNCFVDFFFDENLANSKWKPIQ